MEENKEKQTDLQNVLPPAPEPAAQAPAKPKDGAASVKRWLIALTAVFTLSMLSGLYMIFNGGAQDDMPAAATAAPAPRMALNFLRLSNAAEEGAAVIRVRGVIQESNESGFSARQNASSIARRIRAMADRKEIKALLLDINSPGGTVGAVQDIYDAVLYFKSKNKPVVALFRDVAASGGFYIAMAADKIIAQPGTMTGSIGVIMQAGNFEGLFDKIGVKIIPIKSGRHKDMGAFYRPMTDEETVLLQEMINDTYQQFYNAVKTGRPNIDDASLQVYADGRIFTGARAKVIGLIDDLGGEEAARKYLADMTKIKDIKLLAPRVNDLFDFLSLSAAGLDSRLAALNKVEELSTPKVSYLWTY